MTIATPSRWCDCATSVANLIPSGCPSAMAYERPHHCNIGKSFGLSPKLTQSAASIPKRAANFALEDLILWYLL